jgi:hypothetical protein
MKEEIGVWIDHRKAVIVRFSGRGEEIQTILSKMEKHVRFTGGSASDDGSTEDVRDRQFENHLNTFYDEVIAAARSANSIQIYGPGEAKGELKKRLVSAGLEKRILIVESTDKLTDRQVAAKVRQYLEA